MQTEIIGTSFDCVYDGRTSGYLQEKWRMPRLDANTIRKGDIAIVECAIVRYNLGKPIEGLGWRCWKAGWKLKSITLVWS